MPPTAPRELTEYSRLPKKGVAFIGWKRCVSRRAIQWNERTIYLVVKLLIPADARRVSSGARGKCRASKAKVLAVFRQTRCGSRARVAYSRRHSRLGRQAFAYRVGCMVHPREPFDDTRFEPCGSGIHFFRTRAKAAAYSFI